MKYMLLAFGLAITTDAFAFAYEAGPRTATAELSVNATARAVVVGPACRLRSKDWAAALRERLEAEVRRDRPDLLDEVEENIDSDASWSARRQPSELVSMCVGLPDEVAERDRLIRTGDAVLGGTSIWKAYLQAK